MYQIKASEIGFKFEPDILIKIDREPANEKEWAYVSQFVGEAFPLTSDEVSHGYSQSICSITLPKTVLRTIRVNTEWWEELKERVPNMSEYIREAVNEKWERDGRTPLPGDVGERGVRHDYQERKQDTP